MLRVSLRILMIGGDPRKHICWATCNSSGAKTCMDTLLLKAPGHVPKPVELRLLYEDPI